MAFQLFLIIIASLAIIRTFRQHLAGSVSAHWLLMWTLFWTLVIVVAAIPNLSTRVANLVGIGRGADLIVYTSLVALFISNYRLLVGAEQHRKEITQLTRELAIATAHKPAQK
jgi:hypothetical protein